MSSPLLGHQTPNLWLSSYTGTSLSPCPRQLLNPVQLLPDTFCLSAISCLPCTLSSYLLTPVHFTDCSLPWEAFPDTCHSLSDALMTPMSPSAPFIAFISVCVIYSSRHSASLADVNVGGIMTALNPKIWPCRNANISPSAKLPQFSQSNQKGPVERVTDESRQKFSQS